MIRDKRSAPQPPPNFVWQASDESAREPGATTKGPTIDSATAGREEAERESRREPGKRGPYGRVLIAAAVLVPLAGGSCIVVAYSTGHGDTAVTAARVSQAPFSVTSASAGPTGSPGAGRIPGSPFASPSMSPSPSPPSGGSAGKALVANASQAPVRVVSVLVTPTQTVAAPPAAPTATVAKVPSTPTGSIVGYEGLCLDDRGASVTNYNPVQVFTCNGTDAQQWTLEPDDTVEVFGMCLDVYAAGTAGGTKVDLYQCNGTDAQTWLAQSDGALVNPESGDCLDDTEFGGSGTQVEIWACNGGSDQVWKLP